MKKSLRALSLEELTQGFLARSEPSFRAKQVYEWLWKKSARSFEQMSNLPKSTRAWLEEEYQLELVEVEEMQQSQDLTIKSSFKLFDGKLIEGVLIPTTDRKTACVSSQIGCSLSCKFCATGYMERKRNLSFDEIYDQVVMIKQQTEKTYDANLSNIVFMGMGEPLLNYKNVLAAIERITSPEGLGMSPRRITVSTAGVAKGIKQLGDDQVKFKLALSLHAANDKKRNEIMPINESNNIQALVEALNYFYKKTGNEITFEYILFKDFNDTEKDAMELTKLYRQVPADLINVIEYNSIDQFPFDKPDEDGFERFVDMLQKNRVNVRVRRSRGKDIDAACGQLANKG